MELVAKVCIEEVETRYSFRRYASFSTIWQEQ